jgi:hypothetical protein
MAKRKAEERPSPKKKRAPRQLPASVLWQRRELHSDLRFVFDLAEALHLLDSSEMTISDEAQEEAFKYYKEHSINEVIDKVYDLLQKLIAQGRK